VKKDAPVPKAVEKGEAKKVAAIDMPTGGSIEEQEPTIGKLQSTTSNAGFATGKRVCVVMQAMCSTSNFDGPGGDLRWVAVGCPSDGKGDGIPRSKNEDEVISVAKALIAKEANPEEWALVVE